MHDDEREKTFSTQSNVRTSRRHAVWSARTLAPWFLHWYKITFGNFKEPVATIIYIDMYQVLSTRKLGGWLGIPISLCAFCKVLVLDVYLCNDSNIKRHRLFIQVTHSGCEGEVKNLPAGLMLRSNSEKLSVKVGQVSIMGKKREYYYTKHRQSKRQWIGGCFSNFLCSACQMIGAGSMLPLVPYQVYTYNGIIRSVWNMVV